MCLSAFKYSLRGGGRGIIWLYMVSAGPEEKPEKLARNEPSKKYRNYYKKSTVLAKRKGQ